MTRKISLLAVVPVLALGLSACGSSSGDAGSSSTSPMSGMDMSSSSSSSAAPSSSSPAQESESVITISDFAYKVPVSVAPGATITIRNDDSQAHTVTSKDGGFDVKIDPKGTATLKAPDKAGSYTFVCTFHANMTSTLVVK
jgi:plastocyanin